MTCNVTACNSIIDSYIAKSWRYTSSDFTSECGSCPVVTYPNRLPSTVVSTPATPASVSTAGNSINQAGCLPVDKALQSTDKRSSFLLQSDKNVVLYQNGTAVWASNSTNIPGTPGQLCLMPDGTLTAFNSQNATIWSNKTANAGSGMPYKLVMNDNGNLTIQDKNGVVTWSTNTARLSPVAPVINVAALAAAVLPQVTVAPTPAPAPAPAVVASLPTAPPIIPIAPPVAPSATSTLAAPATQQVAVTPSSPGVSGGTIPPVTNDSTASPTSSVPFYKNPWVLGVGGGTLCLCIVCCCILILTSQK